MELSQPHLTRQYDLIPIEALNMPVTIIGAGAIGSSVALWCAKLGLTDISVWDHDTVAIENVSCQLYGRAHIGMAKVDALKQIVRELSNGTEIKAHNSMWFPDPNLTKGIVVLAVDCMETREKIFKKIGEDHFGVTLVIDSRMGAETALMYAMRPHDTRDRESYKKTLYKNEDAVQEPCTGKATGYTSTLLSGWVVKTIKNIITKQPYPRVTMWNIRDNAMQVYNG